MDVQDFRLTFDGEPERVIRGRVSTPGGVSTPAPFVLVLHGFKGFMNWGFFPELSARLARAGLASVRFNTSSSGIGDDLENFTDEAAFERDSFTRQLEDIARVRDLVSSGGFAGIDPTRAGLFGHSRGGGVGLIHAAERGDYRAVATWAAIEDADRYDEATKAAWRRDGRLPVVNARTGQTLYIGVGALEDFDANRARFDIRAACARLAAPVLVVHGDADESVDVSAAEHLAGVRPAAATRVVVVPGAGHTFGASHPLAGIPADLERVMGETATWFADHLLAKETARKSR